MELSCIFHEGKKPLSSVDLLPFPLPKAWFSQLRKENARKSFKTSASVHVIIVTFHIRKHAA